MAQLWSTWIFFRTENLRPNPETLFYEQSLKCVESKLFYQIRGKERGLQYKIGRPAQQNLLRNCTRNRPIKRRQITEINAEQPANGPHQVRHLSRSFAICQQACHDHQSNLQHGASCSVPSTPSQTPFSDAVSR